MQNIRNYHNDDAGDDDDGDGGGDNDNDDGGYDDDDEDDNDDDDDDDDGDGDGDDGDDDDEYNDNDDDNENNIFQKCSLCPSVPYIRFHLLRRQNILRPGYNLVGAVKTSERIAGCLCV